MEAYIKNKQLNQISTGSWVFYRYDIHNIVLPLQKC